MFQTSTNQTFFAIYNKLSNFHELIKDKPAVIAFSGGKDSTLLARFYQFLYLQKKCPEPILFHLDHSIRNNNQQEIDIILEMKAISGKAIVKKKKYLLLQNELKKA